MSYDFIRANSPRIETNTFQTAKSFPITLAGWGRPTGSSGTARTLMTLKRNTQSSHLTLRLGTTNAWTMVHLYASTTGSVTDTTAVTLNTWYHVAGVFTAYDNRSLYVNGVFIGNDTAAVNVSTDTWNDPFYGTRVRLSTFDFNWDGQIAECGIWSAALTAEEINSLAKGIKPPMIRPQSLEVYSPLNGHPNDLLDNNPPTLTGTPTPSLQHPRRYG